MGWIRRAWDGPFKTPPQQPITVGWALLKLFETLWRLLLIIIILIVLFSIYFALSARNSLSSQVRIELSDNITDTILCNKGYPIFATIRNDSNKNVGEVSFAFRVYPRGKSEDVALDSFNDLHDILKPGQSVTYCYPMPELQAGARGPFTVAADVIYATELPKNVPVTEQPQLTPPPLVQVIAPPTGAPLHPLTPKTLSTKIWTGVGALIWLGLFFSGGAGLIAVCDRIFKIQVLVRFRGKKDDNTLFLIFLFAVLNTLVVWGASVALGSVGVNAWKQLDAWSWAHNFQDGGTLLVAAVAAQWPWAVWFLLGGSRGAPAQ